MRVDVIVDAGLAPGDIARLAVLAEDAGVGTLWTASYLSARDPWSNLVAAAQATRTIGLGAIAVNPWESHPVRIATGLLTLNEYAHGAGPARAERPCAGRARVIVGGGGEALQALGITPARRVRAVGECVRILTGVTPGTPFSFEGELFRVSGYDPVWATAPKPPVYVAANKPQMLRMAAAHADGVMLSDLPPVLCAERIGWVRAHLEERGRSTADYRFSNFLAWHVQADPQQARREARRWLGYRGLFRRWVLTTFISDAEYDLIEAHRADIYALAEQKGDRVDGVPDELLDRCVDRLTLTGTPAEMPRFLEQLRSMERAGCTEVALELHAEPEASLRLIGEHLVPALSAGPAIPAALSNPAARSCH